MSFRKTLIAAALLTMAGLSAAQSTVPVTQEPDPSTKTPVAAAREKHQDKRIDRGVAQGDLTKREARRLKMEQRAIDHKQRKAKADGVVTPEEQARINKMQDRAGKDIARQRHDAASGPAR